MFTTLLFAAALLPAADSPAEKTVGPFTGTVVDQAGKPVAGVTVWLVGGPQDDPQIVTETTSDAKGGFQIAKRPWPAPSRRAMPARLAARDSTGRMGGSRWEPFSGTTSSEFRIKLHEVKDCVGRLVDTLGHPIAKATVRPTEWFMEYVPGESVQQLVFLPTGWSKELTVATDADGRFAIHNVPVVGNIGVKIGADGFGEPGAFWKLDKPAIVQLGRVGDIKGTVTCSQDPKAATEIALQLETDWRSRKDSDTVATVSYRAAGVTKQDGSFTFGKVPPGKYMVTPDLPDSCPYYCGNIASIEVKSEAVETVSLILEQAVKLQGKVVDEQTGEGIAGVNLWLNFQDNKGVGGRIRPATSDAQGAFTLYARPGKATMQVGEFPDQYINPNFSRQQQIIEVKKDAMLEPIRLQRAGVLEGIVVDKAGKPVADAEIRYTDTEYSSTLREIVRTDAVGKFTLKKVSPKRLLIVRARTTAAVAEPVNVVPAELKKPLRLVVDEKTAFTLRGAVRDEAGKPLAQADVALTSHWSWAGGGVGFQSHTGKTDSGGRFEFAALWPGDRYQISVSATGYDKYGSQTVASKPGQLHDFGSITLLATNGAVEGMVVDSSGKPMSQVRVFNSGDGPKPIATLTDEAGKFRLQGFRNGRIFVFAEKSGFRFTGVSAKSGAADVLLKMLRSGETVPRRTVSSSAARTEEEKKQARKLLERRLATGDDQQKQRARSRLARMDGELAQKADKPQNATSERSIQEIAEEDLGEALSLIPNQGDQAFNSLKDLAKHFATSDPAKALRCAEEVIVRVRNLDQPERTIKLAQAGALVARLGDKEAGRKLTHEAAETAAKWQVSAQNRFALSSVAQAVAACDVAEGISLVDKFPDNNDRNRFKADLAASLDDIEKAESLLKDVSSWYAQDARMRLAYRIAANRPADAMRLVEDIQNDDNKAKAFGWIAAAIAPRDSALAYNLIDRSLAILLNSTDRSLQHHGGRPTQAAVLAVQAQKLGYPDMESLVWRVLALRAISRPGELDSAVRVQECNMMMALYLAIIDPDSAKQVLQAIEPQSDCIGSGYSGILRIEWFKAWALVDPRHAVELADRELASAKDGNAKQQAEDSLAEMVELWLTPSDDRLKNISARYSEMFPPKEEF